MHWSLPQPLANQFLMLYTHRNTWSKTHGAPNLITANNTVKSADFEAVWLATASNLSQWIWMGASHSKSLHAKQRKQCETAALIIYTRVGGCCTCERTCNFHVKQNADSAFTSPFFFCMFYQNNKMKAVWVVLANNPCWGRIIEAIISKTLLLLPALIESIRLCAAFTNVTYQGNVSEEINLSYYKKEHTLHKI